tara:strand:+ start:100279 stop:100707 length:429 start_codon:yes stop_codon:yes gene_type:complete
MSNIHRALAIGCLPDIFVLEEEFESLSDLSVSLLDVIPDVGNFLEGELNRAQLLPRSTFPRDVVTMNSTVEFQWGAEQRTQTLRLVFPENYIPDGTRVSIASPVGVALLGMCVGQSIGWLSRTGAKISLKVLKIIPVCHQPK